MCDINKILSDIQNARYGRDVRQAIHDGIKKCYENGNVSEEKLHEMVDTYLKENPIEGGMTEEQITQLNNNTKAISQLSSVVDDYALSRPFYKDKVYSVTIENPTAGLHYAIEAPTSNENFSYENMTNMRHGYAIEVSTTVDLINNPSDLPPITSTISPSSSLNYVEKIDEVNWYIYGSFGKWYIIRNLSTLTDEYQDMFDKIGIYAYINFDSSILQLTQVSFNYYHYVQINTHFYNDSVLLKGDAIETPSTAEVGQIIAVKSVDDSGKPTEWECVDEVQSDYNQNDETAIDYIKNRPCYEEIECVDIIQPGDYKFDYDGMCYRAEADVLVLLEEGQEYTVSFNGTEYELVCQCNISINGDKSYGFGNTKYCHGYGESGDFDSYDVPFFVYYRDDFNPDYRVIRIETYLNGTIPISIKLKTKNIHQLDKKYIPSSIFLAPMDSRRRVDVLTLEKNTPYFIPVDSTLMAGNTRLGGLYSGWISVLEMADGNILVETGNANFVVEASTNRNTERYFNTKYLPTTNTYDYIPTDNYHPATKKYVDDSVNALSGEINTLNTTDKTLVGAINELYAEIQALKG